MENDKNKPVDMREWKQNKEVNNNSNEMSNEIKVDKDEIDLNNERNIIGLIDDGNEIIACSSKNNEIRIMFSNENDIVIKVNEDGRLITNTVIPY
jgi:hypothetical protein